MAYSLDRVAQDLLNAASTIKARVAPVVTKGSINIHDDARGQLSDAEDESSQFAERNIGFERDVPNDLHIRIGYPDEITPLGKAVEYGSVHRPPGGQLASALEHEAPKFAENVVRVGSKVWR
jgi:hypothetical protein